MSHDDEFLRSIGVYTPNTYTPKRKAMAPPDVHIMNTQERRALTRMQQASGLSEEELRKNKGVRQKLAKARSAKGNGHNKAKLIMREARKQAALLLKTHINDPRVEGVARKVINEVIGERYWMTPNQLKYRVKTYGVFK